MNFSELKDFPTNTTIYNNATASPIASWNVRVFPIFFCIATIVLDGVVLALLLRAESRRRPFTIYLICLLGTNMVYAVIQNPLDILHDIRPGWWLGKSACTTYLYSNYVFASCVVHSHVLITINRIWAVTFPIHYRNYHSRRVAIALCCLMYTYVHLCMVPGWLMDAVTYR